MKRVYMYMIVLVLLLMAGIGNVKGQEAWTLKQCIEHAMKYNMELKQQQNRIRKLETEHKNRRDSHLPDLTLGGSQKFDFGRSLNRSNAYEDNSSQSSSLSLSSEMPLFTGFRISASVAQSKYDVLVAQENREVIENNLALNITAGYFQVMLNKEILQIALHQVELTKEQETRTGLLIENGRAPQSQLLEVRAQLSDDELRVTEARNSLRLSMLELMQALELDGRASFDIASTDGSPDEKMISSPTDVYAVSLSYMPQISATQHLVKSGEQAVKVAKSGYYPTLSLGAGITSGYYRMNDAANTSFNEQFKNNMQKSVYLSLRIPLFDRMSTRNKVRTAKIDLDDARLSLENEKKQLYKDIEKAYTDAVAAQDKYKSTSGSAVANEEAHRYALEKYATGKSAVYEYNESKLKLANALSQQAQAKYMYLLKTKVLAFYEGKSLVE